MLTVTRESREGIKIGPDIEVYVVVKANGKIRLSARAPEHVKINRIDEFGRVERKQDYHPLTSGR